MAHILLERAQKLRGQKSKPEIAVVTEDSAALEFVNLYSHELRYCHTAGAWFRWNVVSWVKDETRLAYDWTRKLARSLAVDQPKNKRQVITGTRFASGVEKFAQADQRVAVTASFWNGDPWLLGTPGGTVDLVTGELRDSRQDEGISRLTSVAPVPGDCPRWIQFLNETTGKDEGLIKFLQQWCGYALTGITREHALVFVYGPGGNGKTVFLNVVNDILSDYATVAAMDTFTASKTDKHSTDLAMLHGARLVTASETEEGRAWAEARIKQITGGDRVTARFMRQDNFTYVPQFKLMIIGNHKPVLHNVDDAAKRRFNIVPFLLKPEKPDAELEARLMTEAPAILQWMVDGCLDWQQHGLIRPASVNAATESYFSDQDLLGQWIEDSCDVHLGNRDIWDKSADLFDSWTEYASKAGEQPGSKKAFGMAMQKRGFEAERIMGVRAFRFVRLRPEAPKNPFDFNNAGKQSHDA
jgi:putative DNA primase/helicase